MHKIERLLQKELGDIFQKQTQVMHGVLVSVSVGVIARFRVSFAQCFRDTLLFILQKPGQAIAITLLTAVCIAGAAMLWPLAFLAAAPCFYLKSRCFDRLFADYLKSQKEKEINRK